VVGNATRAEDLFPGNGRLSGGRLGTQSAAIRDALGGCGAMSGLPGLIDLQIT
jgi:hypothetical protein